MAIRITCDGCGKVEEPRRHDNCEITFDLDGMTIIRDYCQPCQFGRTEQIKKILNEE